MQSQPPPSFILATTCSTATTLWLLLMLYHGQLSLAAEGPSNSLEDLQLEMKLRAVVSQNGSSMPQQQQDMKLPVYLRVLATLASVLIFSVGVCGNLLVPLVVIKTKYLRNSTNLFLINLSVADLLVLIVCMPTVLVELHSRPETWSLGEPMCKLSNYVEMLAANGSIFTILAISFERYYAICEPLKAGYKCTRLRATVIICLIWLLSSILTSPILLMAKSLETIYIDGSLVNNCILETDTYWNKMYVFVSMIGFFCLPLLVLVLVYWLIARRLTRENLAMSTNTSQPTSLGHTSYAAHRSSKARNSSGRLLAQNLFGSFQYRPRTKPAEVDPARQPDRALTKSLTCGTPNATGNWSRIVARQARAPANKALSLDNHLMEINKLSLYSNESFGALNGTDTGRDNHLSTICENGAHRKEATIREEEEEEGEEEGEEEEEEEDAEAEERGEDADVEQALEPVGVSSLMVRLVCRILGKRRPQHKSIKRDIKSFDESTAHQQRSNSTDSALKRCPASACISSSNTCCKLESTSGHEPLLLSEAQLKGLGAAQPEVNTGGIVTKLSATKKHSRFNWVRGFSVSSSSASMQTNCTSLLLSEGASTGHKSRQTEPVKSWPDGVLSANPELDRQEGRFDSQPYFERDVVGADSCLDSLPGSTCSSQSTSPDPMSAEISSSTQHGQQQHFCDSMMLKAHDIKQQHPYTSTQSTPIDSGGGSTRLSSGEPILWLKNCSKSDQVRNYEHKPTRITEYCDTAAVDAADTSAASCPTSGNTVTAESGETMLEISKPNADNSYLHSNSRSRAHQARLMKLGCANSVDTPNNHLYPNPAAKIASNKRRSQPNVQVYSAGGGPQLTELMVMQNLSKKQQMDSRRQVVMMLAFVVICFFLLFFPYRVFTIWLILSTEEQVQSLGMETYYNLTYFSRILIYLHSAINPIVYNLISTKFRRAFTSLLFCQGSGSRRKFTNANYATNHKNQAAP